MLFRSVPGLFATTIYALAPVIRLTSHAIKSVDRDMKEATYAFGATRFQSLFKVEIPQAMPTIMAGINQTTMMAVAMVVTCSMIGAKGLGMIVFKSINMMQIGTGLEGGISIVFVAIIMDRITQGLIKKSAEKQNA